MTVNLFHATPIRERQTATSSVKTVPKTNFKLCGSNKLNSYEGHLRQRVKKSETKNMGVTVRCEKLKEH